MFIRPELGGKVQDVYFSLHTVFTNVNNGVHVRTLARLRRQRQVEGFLGAISLIFRHDNVYLCADPGIFVVGGGGGGWSGAGPTDRKKL